MKLGELLDVADAGVYCTTNNGAFVAQYNGGFDEKRKHDNWDVDWLDTDTDGNIVAEISDPDDWGELGKYDPWDE